MLQFLRSKRLLPALLSVILVAGLVAAAFFASRQAEVETRKTATLQTEAPPDLAKLRERYTEGVAALQRGDGAEAVRRLSSFGFGSRAVEEYRLYYLANAHQLNQNLSAARLTLARLWRRTPRMLYASDAALNLASLYSREGNWSRSAEVYAGLSRSANTPAIVANARWGAATQRLNAGDISGALYAARNIVIHQPRSEQAEDAAALVRTLQGIADNAAIPMTPSERLDRAVALMRSNDAQTALEELTTLEGAAPHMKDAVKLQRGIALRLLHRYEDSNKALEPLTPGAYKYAIPALQNAAKNYAVLESAINPEVIKTVKERKKVGTVKVRVGKGKKRRTVTKPKYQNVFRQVKLIDLAKKKKKDEYHRLAGERLKDLLLLPLDDDVRLETLNALMARAIAKKQDEYLEELIPQIIKIDRLADPGLQYFWDKGWGAYTRGDLDTARKIFRFIADTYTSPNVRRQSEYWYARAAERQGEKEQAQAIYRQLAAAPYTDLYALHAIKRGAPRQPTAANPLRRDVPDWSDIAEKEMPEELELAYELTALASMRDALNEIRRNMRRPNVRFAEALLADVHHATGNDVLMYLSLRRAWPQLATVEQDTVPPYFLRMYYPVEYGEEIEKYAAERRLDPHLVRALILQESYYNPTARSRVGATGLMQLMPPTAREHARRLSIPFGSLRLESPDVNIRLGTYHLKMLMNMFRGETHLAVAAYNAGQGNVAKWRRAAPAKPLDEFLESIPFQETRNYVKRVAILRSAYARLTL